MYVKTLKCKGQKADVEFYRKIGGIKTNTANVNAGIAPHCRW